MSFPRHSLKSGGLRLIACALTLAATSALAAPAASLPGANVESLLELARTHNPEFAAMRYEAEAAAERVYPAGALPDPTLRTELRDITNQGMDAGPNLLPGRIGSTKYTLIQPVPFWGKRDLRQDVAEAQANQAKASASAGWIELAARIKKAYAQYYLIVHSEHLTQETLDVTKDHEDMIRIRYASGLVPQQDVIRVQLELTELRSKLLALANERHHAKVQLNALLKQPATTPLAEPSQLRKLPQATMLDYEALQQRLSLRSPQLQIEAARVDAAEKNRELVYRNRYPDFNLGLSPIQTGSRIREWELMIELNIPLQQESRRSQEREAQAMLAAAESRKEATLTRMLGDLSENIFALYSARLTEALTRTTMLPQAEMTFKSAQAAYETGKVDFATLLEAHRQSFKAQLEIIKAQAESQTRLAEIERLLGEDL